jgi:hypothetical protein
MSADYASVRELLISILNITSDKHILFTMTEVSKWS